MSVVGGLGKWCVLSVDLWGVTRCVPCPPLGTLCMCNLSSRFLGTQDFLVCLQFSVSLSQIKSHSDSVLCRPCFLAFLFAFDSEISRFFKKNLKVVLVALHCLRIVYFF